tara:strand:- start:4813 stop:5115 length:303 start_codon:yes stop_codon:yes gene_type:complete
MLTIILTYIGGLIFSIAAVLSLSLAIILSFSYKKKNKLFRIGKYYIINNRSFDGINSHFFDNPCSKIIILYIIYKYETKCNVLEKYNFLKNHYEKPPVIV